MKSKMAALFLIALVAAGSGCRDTKKQQAKSLVAAMERFQHALDAQRPSVAREVAALRCTEAEVVPTCQACVAATADVARALAFKDEVQRALADLEANRITRDQAKAMNLDGKLGDAVKALDEGRKKMGECEVGMADLKRTLSL